MFVKAALQSLITSSVIFWFNFSVPKDHYCPIISFKLYWCVFSFCCFLVVFQLACKKRLDALPLQYELLRLRPVWELSHGLGRHNWRQAGLLPNRDLGSHDLSEQLSPTVLPCSISHCKRECPLCRGSAHVHATSIQNKIAPSHHRQHWHIKT